MTEVLEQQAPLPAPPRPISRRARSRAWAESPVRVWMVLTILVAVSLIYLATQNAIETVTERRLIYNGRPERAKIVEVNGDADPRHAVKLNGEHADRMVKLSYPGAPQDADQREISSPKNDGRRPGDVIQIRVDPNDPAIWTDRTEPQPWVAHFAVALMLAPALLIALVVLLIRHRQMLRIWRDGIEIVGTVVEVRQSAIAPRSRVVRLTLQDSDNRRILSTFFPNQAGEIQKGDELVLLMLPTNSSRIIVAELYEEQKELNH